MTLAQVRLGALVFDPVASQLWYRGRAVLLTRSEVWLLGRLCQASAAPDALPLSARRLAVKLGTSEAAIRNHVAHLREKCDRVLGAQRVIVHDRRRGYALVSIAARPLSLPA